MIYYNATITLHNILLLKYEHLNIITNNITQ